MSGPDLDSAWKEGEKKTQEHQTQGHQGRDAEVSSLEGHGRRQSRVRCTGGVLSMAHASHGLKQSLRK